MRDDARIQTLIELTDKCINDPAPADVTLDAFFRKNRFIGSKDRHCLSDMLWDILRRRYALEHKAKSSDARNIVIAYLDYGKEKLENLFTGEKYAPAPLKPEETEFDLTSPPPEISPFLLKKLKESFPERWQQELSEFNRQARLDLRVNTLKTSIEECLHAINARKTPLSKLGIYLDRRVNIREEQLFKDGKIDIQDEGSQLICEFCDIKGGEKVLDLCAGAGGKALTMAILMKNKGSITVNDSNKQRMKDIEPRAKRAGITIINEKIWKDKRFDLVLIDAPCTGSGTLRRNPDKKWKITPEIVEEISKVQMELLEKSSFLSNRIVYATCSFLKEENEMQVESFLIKHPQFRKVKERILSPLANGTDSFYMCMVEKKT